MAVTFLYDHKKPRSFTLLKKGYQIHVYFSPSLFYFEVLGRCGGCRCMRDNIIYGWHETTFRCAGGLLLLTLSFWRSISQEDVRYDWQYFLDGPNRRLAEIRLLFDLCRLCSFAAWCLVLVKYAICNKTYHKTWRVSYTLVMVWNIKELCVSSAFLLWICGSFWRLHAAHFSLSLVVTTSAIARGCQCWI
jgi:hypothetical protein